MIEVILAGGLTNWTRDRAPVEIPQEEQLKPNQTNIS
jgi:hypothetical protein